ncbi:ATP-binding domain-containing protein, partial [Sporosarcina sp. NCCP-2222]|uniref:ATP-binding domain-containing protein n=1 Tax=Sporosarcina sp. NCCP-2222 TaxID=2935073 RepID=UPI0020C1227B
ESNVFNGDMGEVIAILKAKETVDKKEMLVVSYDGIEVTYERNDLNQITLAYCCSIHKSQGSEFPTVIMPVVRSYRKMLRRNLLYTGITRAKNFLILCGEPAEFREGIGRTDELARQTTLKQRLQLGDLPEGEEIPAEPLAADATAEKAETTLSAPAGKKPETTEPTDGNGLEEVRKEIQDNMQLTKDNVLSIDPMIGMQGLTPYNFMEATD